jgi:hypothetical protein
VTDFFLSYNSADENWAIWIAYVLEEHGSTTFLQSWDFRPGTNFVLHMQKAAADCDRTIAVLSPAYLTSNFAQSEWAAAFADDPQGQKGKLLPVMVEKCSPPGLLKSIVHIDVVGADEEEARRRLVEGVRPGRNKPATRPSFPGSVRSPKPVFPAASPPSRRATYVPKIPKAPTDVDRKRFMRQAFDTLASGFEQSLAELAGREDAVEFDFDRRSTVEFTAEIFLRGKSVCRCRIWQGGPISGDGISYAEGSLSGNATNEMLVLSQGGDLALSALMSSFHRFEEGIDPKRMTPDQTFDYLWRRFVAPLER